MRHAIDLTGFGTYAEAAVVAEVAATAEAAAWDGLFIWDHLGWVDGIPCGDPWISMTAAAAATSSIRIGFDVTPLPRRRPHIVATAAAALDRLADGRLTLGVGVSDPGDASLRADYQHAGATWWLECIHDLRGPYDSMLDRVRQGP